MTQQPGHCEVRLDDTGRLAEDLPCVGCGYNLRGIDGEGRCPECGLAVGRSTVGHYLRYRDPRWLRSVWGGLNRLGVAILCVALLAGLGRAGLFNNRVLPEGLTMVILAALVATPVVVGVHGLWKSTGPDPAGLAEAWWSARRLTRQAVLGSVLMFGVFVVWARWADHAVRGSHFGDAYRLNPLIIVTQALNIMVVLLVIAAPVMLLLHGRSLVRRIPRPWLGRASLALALWLAVSGTLFMAVSDNWFCWLEAAKMLYDRALSPGMFPSTGVINNVPFGPPTPVPPAVAFWEVLRWVREVVGLALVVGLLGLPAVLLGYWPAMQREAQRAKRTWAALPWGTAAEAGGGNRA